MSGFILPSEVGPRLLKSDTSSGSPGDRRVEPDMLDPTARQFFDNAGDAMLQPDMSSPRLPAAKMSRCSGFWAGPRAWRGGGVDATWQRTVRQGGRSRRRRRVFLINRLFAAPLLKVFFWTPA